MAEYTNPVESFAKGYAAMGAVQEDMASKDILKQAYAGVTPEQAKDPQAQQNIYNQAAMMAGQRGQASLAYSFQKQAKELDSAAQTKQANDLTLKEGRLSYAGQIIGSASNKEDLLSAISAAGVDEPVALQLASAVKRFPDTPEGFKQAKEMLEKVSMTAKEKIEAQKAVIEGIYKAKQIENIDADNLRSDREEIRKREEFTQKEKDKQQAQARLRIQDAYRAGRLPDPKDVALSRGEEPSSSSFLEQTGSRESGGNYSVVNKQSGALGKYQIMPNTYEGLKKQDPSLPSKEEFLKNPEAQDKAAKLLEQDVERNLKASGKELTTANKNAYWYFGPAEGNKVLDAKLDTPISSVVRPVVMEQNPNLKNKEGTSKTVGQVLDELNRGAPTSAAAEKLTSEARQARETDLEEAYQNAPLNIQKKVGSLGPLGVDYGIEPYKMPYLGEKAKTAVQASYEVLGKTEEIAQFIKEHPKAAGTMASLIKKYGTLTEQSLDNIKKDKSYTQDIEYLSKELLDISLKDAAAGSGGRLNQYLEKSFKGIYSQALSPETLTGVLKLRQKDAAKVISENITGAKKDQLDTEKYKLLNSKSSKDYLGDYEKSPEASTKKTERTSPGLGGRSSGAGTFKSSKSAADEAAAAGF